MRYANADVASRFGHLFGPEEVPMFEELGRRPYWPLVYRCDPPPDTPASLARDRELRAQAVALRAWGAKGIHVPADAEWDEDRQDWRWDEGRQIRGASLPRAAGSPRPAPRPDLARPVATPALSADELRRFAFHEAAHAVTARAAGFDVDRVSIGSPNGFGGLGITEFNFDAGRPISPSLAALSLDERITVTYIAGALGELLGTGAQDSGTSTRDCQEARAQLHKVAPFRSRRFRSKRLLTLRRVAWHLLGTQPGREMLDVVATALEQRRALEGKDLDALLAPFN